MSSSLNESAGAIETRGLTGRSVGAVDTVYWQDTVDVRSWGVWPDGRDVTAALCAALDAANGDYAQLVEYGKNRGTLVIPPGDYTVDMSKLTGIHAEAGRFVIRCNVVCSGRIQAGDFLIAHARSLNVTGLAARSLSVRGVQFCLFSNLDMSGDIILMGSKTFSLPGLMGWGGGSYWNAFERLRAGTSAGGGKLILDVSDGAVNQNTFTQFAGGGILLTNNGSEAFIDCHQNIFTGLDTSGSPDFELDNSTVANQANIVIGLYGEVVGNGRIKGSWHILGHKSQFNNMASTMGLMNHLLFSEPMANQQGGDFLSASVRNLCPSGDWSVITNDGHPVDYTAVGDKPVIGIDADEPSGCGRYYGYTATTQRSWLKINLMRTTSGYIRGAFYYKGDDPAGLSVATVDGQHAYYMDVTKYVELDGGWRLYRVALPTDDKSKPYRLLVTVDPGKAAMIGGSVFTPYHASFLPVFCGWDHAKGKHHVKPTWREVPIGFIYYRTSPVNPPADPVYAWVHQGEGHYAAITVA